jgi:hypothetical protein
MRWRAGDRAGNQSVGHLQSVSTGLPLAMINKAGASKTIERA